MPPGNGYSEYIRKVNKVPDIYLRQEEDKKSTNNCFILKPFNDQNMMEI